MIRPFLVVNLDGFVTPAKTLAFLYYTVILIGMNLPDDDRVGRFLVAVFGVFGDMQHF